MNLKLPIGGKGHCRAISVGELIKELRKFPKDMAVVYHNGWVTGVKPTKGRSQITCDCWPNCADGCISNKTTNDKQVQIDLEC